VNKSSTIYKSVFKAVNWVKNEVPVATESASLELEFLKFRKDYFWHLVYRWQQPVHMLGIFKM